MKTALSAGTAPTPRLRRFAIDVAITQVFNLLIALLVTYVVRVPSPFPVNLVISMCVGTLAVTFIDGGRLLLWGQRKPPVAPFVLLLLVSFPAAQYLGHMVASQLLGRPAHDFGINNERYASALLIGSTISFLAIIWFFWSRSRLQILKTEAEAEKARAAAIEKQAMQAQLQMLQAQIEPHMLFNTLANLQGLIAVDPPRAQHMLEQLIQYLRATLSSSRADKTTLAHEFSLMNAYFGLMQVRMGTRLRYALDLPDDLRGVLVPPMLLQPLAENAIKHGLEPKIDGGEVRVSASRRGDMLTLTIADTGLGLDAAPASENGTRVGLANIRERLHALYADRASFSLTPNTPYGVIAAIRIPL
ncbi:MAG TPA: histidine kinase [Noviherbaspirillum sp.]